jgi:hypothetical protein
MISYIDTHFPMRMHRGMLVVKLVLIQHNQISTDEKCLEHYHVQDIAGKCFDMQLVVIELS